MRKPKFRVATLLWMTTLAAVSVGWWLDRQRLSGERDYAKQNWAKAFDRYDVEKAKNDGWLEMWRTLTSDPPTRDVVVKRLRDTNGQAR